jgi:hypothetical protein
LIWGMSVQTNRSSAPGVTAANGGRAGTCIQSRRWRAGPYSARYRSMTDNGRTLQQPRDPGLATRVHGVFDETNQTRGAAASD